MNKFAVLIVLVACLALGQSMYLKRKYPVKQVYCYDYQGRPVLPGQGYYDGCNTCTCGTFGRPTVCTMRHCGDIIKPVKPIYPVNPIKPVNPIYPVNPIKPVNPIYPVNPIKPVNPIYPVNPIRPVKPVYPVNPIKPVNPIYPATY